MCGDKAKKCYTWSFRLSNEAFWKVWEGGTSRPLGTDYSRQPGSSAIITRASGDTNEVNHVLRPRKDGKEKKRESGMKFRFRLPGVRNLIPASGDATDIYLAVPVAGRNTSPVCAGAFSGCY